MNQKIEILNRNNNGSKKWNKKYIKKRFNIENQENIYPLFIADMDFKHSDLIIEEMKEIVLGDDYGYFDPQDDYFESIVTWQKQVHNLDVIKDDIIPANGTIAALHIAASALSQGDNFLLLTPVYGVFKTLAENFGTMHTYDLIEDENHYSFEINDLEKTILDKKIGTLLFCNPHNPSGKVWSNQELDSIVDVCKKNNVKIFSDEIHADLSLSGIKYKSMYEYKDVYDQIIVSTSPNKSFNLSGLTTSYLLCSNTKWQEKINEELLKYHISLNRMGMEASKIVYNHGYDWLKSIMTIIEHNLKMVQSYCLEAGLEAQLPDAGYLIWIKGEKLNDLEDYVQDLAKKTGVLLETGSRFIKNYDKHLRINVATDSKLLEEAMKLFVEHYKQYEGE